MGFNYIQYNQNNMKEFIKDVETFGKKHWKPLLAILVVVFLLKYYPDLKNGIMDGWLNK